MAEIVALPAGAADVAVELLSPKEEDLKAKRRASFKLDDFLKARPKSERLKGMNILKGDAIMAPALVEASEKLARDKTRDSLTRLLARRPERGTLEKNNIIKGEINVDPKNIAVQSDLRKKMLMSKLERGMSLRPSVADLQKRGVMKEYSMERLDDVTPDEAHAIFLRIGNKGGTMAHQLAAELRNYRMERAADEKAFDIRKLERRLSLRPSREKLMDTNVMKMRGGESGTRLLATRALAGKLSERPTMEELKTSGLFGSEDSDLVVEIVSEPHDVITEEDESAGAADS